MRNGLIVIALASYLNGDAGVVGSKTYPLGTVGVERLKGQNIAQIGDAQVDFFLFGLLLRSSNEVLVIDKHEAVRGGVHALKKAVVAVVYTVAHQGVIKQAALRPGVDAFIALIEESFTLKRENEGGVLLLCRKTLPGAVENFPVTVNIHNAGAKTFQSFEDLGSLRQIPGIPFHIDMGKMMHRGQFHESLFPPSMEPERRASIRSSR